MNASELRARARQEVDELGPEPSGSEAKKKWREERTDRAALLAELADGNADLLYQAWGEVHAASADDIRELRRQHADWIAATRIHMDVASLLFDAAKLAEVDQDFGSDIWAINRREKILLTSPSQRFGYPVCGVPLGEHICTRVRGHKGEHRG